MVCFKLYLCDQQQMLNRLDIINVDIFMSWLNRRKPYTAISITRRAFGCAPHTTHTIVSPWSRLDSFIEYSQSCSVQFSVS